MNSQISNLIRVAVALWALCASALAQTPNQGTEVIGNVQDLGTVNGSVSIATGNTFQQVLAASTSRRSLTIQNNQQSGTDNCFLIIGQASQITAGTTTTSSTLTIAGSSIAAGKASIVLQVGQAYTRFWPNVPSDVIFGTCASTSDSLYVDTQ